MPAVLGPANMPGLLARLGHDGPACMRPGPPHALHMPTLIFHTTHTHQLLGFCGASCASWPVNSSALTLPAPLLRAADAIPLLSPFIAPNIRALGPILSQLATSPLRSGMEQWIDLLKGERGHCPGEAGACCALHQGAIAPRVPARGRGSCPEPWSGSPRGSVPQRSNRRGVACFKWMAREHVDASALLAHFVDWQPGPGEAWEGSLCPVTCLAARAAEPGASAHLGLAPPALPPLRAGVSPGIVKQVIPVVEQLTPIYLDIANGAQVRGRPPALVLRFFRVPAQPSVPSPRVVLAPPAASGTCQFRSPHAAPAHQILGPITAPRPRPAGVHPSSRGEPQHHPPG